MFKILRHQKLFFNVIRKDNCKCVLENYFEHSLFNYNNNVLQHRYFFKTNGNSSSDRCIDETKPREKKNTNSGSDANRKSSSNNENSKQGPQNCYKSIVRHNYARSCENAINKQINMELYAAYWYTSLQYHFDRDDIALIGFSKYFKECAAEELAHASNLMVFQMKRGGIVQYFPIQPPPTVEWTAAMAIAESIELEKQVTKSLEELADLAADEEDNHLNDYICNEFLVEQFQAIKDLANLLSRIKRAGPGVGLVVVDSELQGCLKK